MISKTLLVLSVTAAFVAGTMVSAGVVFADEKPTKLEKECVKEPKKPEKIKPHCELLLFIDGLQEQILQIEIPPSEPGIVETYSVVEHQPILAGERLTIIAECDPGDVALGGGHEVLNTNTHSVRISAPDGHPPNGWKVEAFSSENGFFDAWVVCGIFSP